MFTWKGDINMTVYMLVAKILVSAIWIYAIVVNAIIFAKKDDKKNKNELWAVMLTMLTIFLIWN